VTTDEFPIAPERIVATAAGLFDAQARPDIAAVLRAARASIEPTGYDNWRGGSTYYTLNLELPVAEYARVEQDLAELEGTVAEKLRLALRTTGTDVLNAVVITPSFEAPSQEQPLAADEADRIWDRGMFRLFLSHVSDHKAEVAQLKDELYVYGVSGFVAHEDIEPSLEWQNEIELALRSMDAMAAVLTPDFHASHWTDQELGIAVGRGAFVLPIRAPNVPYGFIAKSHGLAADLANPRGVASNIVDILLRRPRTADQMREGLVRAFEQAGSFANARALTSKLEVAGPLTASQAQRIVAAIDANDQVLNAHGVPDRIRSLAQPSLPPEPSPEPDLDDLDDLPF
jgi:hypothetical protein